MKAVIPVAKEKDAMFPLNDSRPTALMPVMGKPLVKHLINALQSIGVEDIYLVTNHMEGRFEEEFGEYTNVNLVHQEELTGTAAAVKTCDFIEDDFFVVNGDVMVTENDLEKLRAKHREAGSSATLLATEENRPEKFGVLSITNDRIKRIEEKPEEAENMLVNTGIYVFDPEVFDVIEQLEEETSITAAVNRFVERDSARFELVDDYWFDIGSPKKLWEADRVKRDYEISGKEVHEEAEVHENAEVRNSIIREGARIENGAVVEDYSYIGENVTVAAGTVVRNSTVSRDSWMEQASVEDALLFEELDLDSFVAVKNAVMGEKTSVKPGTVIRESFIGSRSFIEMNNSVLGTKFVPDARTDIGELSK